MNHALKGSDEHGAYTDGLANYPYSAFHAWDVTRNNRLRDNPMGQEHYSAGKDITNSLEWQLGFHNYLVQQAKTLATIKPGQEVTLAQFKSQSLGDGGKYWKSLNEDIGGAEIRGESDVTQLWAMSHPRLYDISGQYGTNLRYYFLGEQGDKKVSEAAFKHYRQKYKTNPQKFDHVIPKQVLDAALGG